MPAIQLEDRTVETAPAAQETEVLLAVGEPSRQSTADIPAHGVPPQASIGLIAYTEAAQEWIAKLVELDPQRFNGINVATLQQLLEAELRYLAEQSAGQPEPGSVAGLLVELANALGDGDLAGALEGLLEEVLEYQEETGEGHPDSGSNSGPTGPVLSSGTSTYSEPSDRSFGSSTSDTLAGLEINSGDIAAQDGFGSVAYSVSYGSGSVALPEVNGAPFLAADAGASDEDTVLNAGALGVLANDIDPERDILTVTAFDAVSAKGAAVTVNADGSYTYDPTGSATLGALAVGENTTDTFTYTVSDGNGASGTATVTITVTGVNDAPTAAADTATTAVDTAVIKDVLANDSDPDTTDTLSVSAVTQGTSGTVVDNGDGTVTYTPNAGFIGLDSYTYDISDGNGGSDTATVSVTVGNVVAGTAGADALTGTAGADAIYGYGGDDTLTGAGGADVFYFSLASNEGSDSVLDFSTAAGDIISFTDVTDVEPVAA
ncbi:MAG: tandem-95 repeat protein, partial [Proteobacteria bacterium]|nr:tandem-95 repeat protein [Pseudomonadota bacterium]